MLRSWGKVIWKNRWDSFGLNPPNFGGLINEYPDKLNFQTRLIYMFGRGWVDFSIGGDEHLKKSVLFCEEKSCHDS